MNYYIDIKLLPDAELSETFLMNKVYAKLHKILSDLRSNSIGISFPNYRKLLGGVLRIHATKENLEQLQSLNWLSRLTDYCNISQITEIPEDIEGHRTVSRIQSNMTESKLRRLIKRGSISSEEAKEYRAKMFQEGLDNPYVELESSSNGHKYRRYIAFSELSDTPKLGEFDQFGLSKGATIPWF